MILVDANLLVYACVKGMPQHEAARGWLAERLKGTPAVGLPWPSLLAFVRLTTNPRVFGRPQTIGAAWKQVEAWLDEESVWTPQATEQHPKILATLFERDVQRANLVPDAHLAALAIEHGLTLCSSDADFARFKGLRWENPLAM